MLLPSNRISTKDNPENCLKNHIWKKQNQLEESTENEGIQISNDVIAVISGVAVSEVQGVSSMAGGFAGGISEVLSGKKNLAKGIKVDKDENKVKIDVNIIVEYGTRIPDVAFEIQNRVKTSVENMTGLKVEEVNENSLLQLRDALGIIRVMRRRNYYFISEYVDAGFMNEYLKGLDSKYIKLEYRRLRKTAIDMDFLNEFTSELIKDDIDITNKIKEKIGERIC